LLPIERAVATIRSSDPGEMPCHSVGNCARPRRVRGRPRSCGSFREHQPAIGGQARFVSARLKEERPRQPCPVMLASLACAPRRLTCRYWAGRVALRENRAPTHGLTAPRLSEAARPKSSLYEIPSRRVRDSTLVAWYRSLYAPRAGGAY